MNITAHAAAACLEGFTSEVPVWFDSNSGVISVNTQARRVGCLVYLLGHIAHGKKIESLLLSLPAGELDHLKRNLADHGWTSGHLTSKQSSVKHYLDAALELHLLVRQGAVFSLTTRGQFLIEGVRPDVSSPYPLKQATKVFFLYTILTNDYFGTAAIARSILAGAKRLATVQREHHSQLLRLLTEAGQGFANSRLNRIVQDRGLSIRNWKRPQFALKLQEEHIPAYYTKFTWAREFTVVGREASDAALLKANDTIRKMFAYRHDILKALIADGVKLVVLGRKEGLTDLPELQPLREAKDFDPGARFFEYTPATKVLVVSEENVLGDPREPLIGDCQVIRGIAKALYDVTSRRQVDPNWDNRGRDVQQYELRVKRLDVRFDQQLQALYTAACSAGRWKGTAAAHDPVSFWAAGVLAYFDAAGQDAAPADLPHPVVTRAALEAYDQALYALVNETMAYEGHVDWRYRVARPAEPEIRNPKPEIRNK